MLTRYHDWPTRLESFLAVRRNEAFRYGENDCCLFACDCIAAMTGHDLAAWFRGRYRTRKGALEAIRERVESKRRFPSGMTTKNVTANVAVIAGFAAEEAQMPSVAVKCARRGDMVLVGSGARAVLGIASLSGMDVMCLAKSGIVRVEWKHATAAWRV